MDLDTEFRAVTERAVSEHPDLAYWKESDREAVAAMIVTGIKNGCPPHQAVEEAVGLVREIIRKPRPISAEHAAVDDEIARRNRDRRAWGMR